VQELSDLGSWYYQQFVMLTDVGVIRQYYSERFQAAITGLYLAKSTNVGGTFGIGALGHCTPSRYGQSQYWITRVHPPPT